MQKEGYGWTLSICIGPKESHDSTFGQSIEPKDSHVCIQIGYYHKLLLLQINTKLKTKIIDLQYV